ncbi:MAG TPA: hypothetical protein VIY51_11675, partial [Xanthobacteraceae bacterium]
MAAQTLAHVFDRTGKISRPSILLTMRETWSLLSYYPSAPEPAEPADGRGHVVLLVPAWFTTDAVNEPL